MSRQLVLWRHGQTEHNVQRRWQGQLDTELSAPGREQAAAAAPHLARLEPSLLRSSDLRRASETADALAALTGLEVRTDPRLREIHVGQWQGLTAGDVAERHPELNERLAAGEDLPRGVDGESVAQVVQRGRPALDELLDELEPGALAVVTTHGVTGRALAADLVGIEQHTAWRALGGLGNCHWVRLREHRLGWRIESWNTGVDDGADA